MLEKGDVVIWDSSETVYQVGDKGFEAYLSVLPFAQLTPKIPYADHYYYPYSILYLYLSPT